MIVTLSLMTAGAGLALLELVVKVAEAATAEVIDTSRDDGTAYEVLSKLAQGVFPSIACPHLVNPLGLWKLVPKTVRIDQEYKITLPADRVKVHHVTRTHRKRRFTQH